MSKKRPSNSILNYLELKANKLSLNLSKTNYIIFRSKTKILPVLDSSIKIDNKEITQVTTTKLLGV